MAVKTQMLKGLLEGCVLEVISRKESYGYAICEELNESGFADLNEGTVYPILARMEKGGWIECEKRKSPFGQKRKVYSLTETGKNRLEDFKETWKSIKNNVDNVMKASDEYEDKYEDKE